MSESSVNASPIIEMFENMNIDSETNNGKKIIKQYNSVSEELYSLNRGVGLRDISHLGIMELKGKDVLDFLHRITSNSTKELPKEKLTKTFFTTEKGRIIDLAAILNFDAHQLLVCSADFKNKVKSWIGKYIITDDVSITDVDGKYVLLELIGPQTDPLLTMLCGSVINSILPDSFRVINAEDMLFFLIKLKEANGSYKFWLLADPETGKKLVWFMKEHHGVFDFSLVGEDAYNIFRIEQGLPAAPNELNDLTNPHEVKLLEYVDFKKGCYIGQEVIARLETYNKVQRLLMGVKFKEVVAPDEDFALSDEGNMEAGRITSIVYSEKLKSWIGLALIKKFYAESGKELIAVNSAEKKFSVVVHNLPFKK